MSQSVAQIEARSTISATISPMNTKCPLCDEPGGELIWQNHEIRVVLVNEPMLAGFCRVIWKEHVGEMTDLAAHQRQSMMHVVYVVEQAVRQIMQPDKVNLASLGNMVPHLHWHVIPRYLDDVYFPGSVWSEPKNQPVAQSLQQRQALVPALRLKLHELLGTVL